MKIAVVFALIVVALALVHTSDAQSHNFEWGRRETGDRQLFREIVVKKGKALRKVIKDVSYMGQARITYIKCTDQYTNGDGGYASLLSGGAGYTETTIHLKSQRGHGLSFIVEIFGQ